MVWIFLIIIRSYGPINEFCLVWICEKVFLSCYSYNQSITCRESKLKYGQKILYPLLTDATAKINILAILLKKIGSSPLKMNLYA